VRGQLREGAGTPMNRMTKVLAAAAAVATAAAALAGCASASGGASSGDSSYKLGAIVDLSNTEGAFQEFENAFVAAVRWANAHGGADGHKIQLVTCDSQDDANATAACGRQMAADHVFAVVSTTFGGEFGPYLEKAGIAWDGTLNDTSLLTNPIAFPNESGGVAGIPGIAALAALYKCKDVTLLEGGTFNAAAQASLAKGFNSVAKTTGLKSAVSFVPAGAPDYSPYISAALQKGVDCLALQGSDPADEVSMVRSAYQLKPSIKLFAPEYLFTQSVASSLGTDMNKLVFTDLGRQSSAAGQYPQIAQFVQGMKKYAPQPVVLNATNGLNWAAVMLFIKALVSSSSHNAAGVLHYMDHLTSYSSGFVPTLNFTKAPPNPLGPRMFAPYAAQVVYRNGQFVDAGPFYDVFTGKLVANS
jgi:ABC-type branched-subunit amino acid transport system substrate-binding protein